MDVGLAPPEGAAGNGASAALARWDARWCLQPGKGIEPASATAVAAATARLEPTIARWGKRQTGTAELLLVTITR